MSFAVAHSLDYLVDMRTAVQMGSTEAKTLIHRKCISSLIQDALISKKCLVYFSYRRGVLVSRVECRQTLVLLVSLAAFGVSQMLSWTLFVA